jgi:hypothetical protein
VYSVHRDNLAAFFFPSGTSAPTWSTRQAEEISFHNPTPPSDLIVVVITISHFSHFFHLISKVVLAFDILRSLGRSSV